MSHRLKSLKQLSCITIGLILSTAFSSSPASAKQFKKLVQVGQILPGIDQPLERFSSTSIGLDQQVAVLLSGELSLSNGERTEGVYSITKSGEISLLQKGFSRFSTFSLIQESFTAPSISQGKIAYGTFSAVYERGNPSRPINSILQVGTPGEIKAYGSIISNSRSASLPQVSIVNGLVYSLARFDDANSNSVSLLTVLDTKAAKPVFKTISTDINNTEIRTGSKSLVVLSTSRTGPYYESTTVYKLFERPHNGQFIQLNPLGKKPGSCGFAVSGENVVSCSAEDNRFVLSTRFGKAAQFTQIQLPQNINSIATPSISAEKVIFKATETTSNGTANVIYLSNKGKAPTAIIRTGDLLDGKTVISLSLSNNGRAIAKNSVVFLAGFSDAPSALYRVDL